MSLGSQLIEAARQGNSTEVENLIARGANVNAKSDFSRTPLSWAAEGGHLSVVKLLLDNRAEVNIKDDFSKTPLSWAAEDGHLSVVKLLLDNRAEVNIKDRNGRIPLHFAAQKGHLPVVQYLVDNFSEVGAKDNDDNTPLYLATEKGKLDVVRYFVDEKKVGVNDIYNKNTTLLHLAAKEGYFSVVEYLVAKGANVNIKDSNGIAPLHYAAAREYFNIAKYLVNKGAEVNVRDKDNRTILHDIIEHPDEVKYFIEKGVSFDVENNYGVTPLGAVKEFVKEGIDDNYSQTYEFLLNMQKLFNAAGKGNLDKVTECINKGANIKAINKNNKTPLHLAAQGGYRNIVQLLLDNRANIEATDEDNRTALHEAALYGKLDVVKLLVEHEANIEAKDKDNKTPLDLAREKGHTDIVNFLSKEENLNQELLTAAAQGDLDKVTNLIDRGAEVEARGEDNKTPLHLATEEGHKGVVEFLLSKGAKIEAQDNNGWTPLHYAAWKGHQEVARLLLDRGARINAKSNLDNDSKEPIHVAAAYGKTDVVKSLLDSGVNINVTTESGLTPLHYAAREGYLEIAQLLLDRGAKVKAKNGSGKTPLDLADKTEIIKLLVRKLAELDEVTPLHWAVKHRSLKIVNLFIEGDVNAKEENHGWTPLHFAAQENKKDIAELLIERNATVDARNYRGWTPLHEAASKNSFNITQLLVEKGADVNARNNKGWTPLHEAAKKGNSDIVDFLIKTNGTDIEARSRNREDTPLHVAAGENQLRVVELLVNNKANVNAINKYGKKPFDIAHDKGYTNVTDFLEPKPSRHRRDVSNKQELSGSTRITSWINDYIAWIKDSASEFIGNIPFKRTTSLLTNSIQSDQIDYSTSPKKQSTYGSEDNTKATISQIDFNGTIALLDLFVRRFTGEKYPSFQGASLSQLEVLGYALNITQAFEKAIEQAAKESGISMHRLSIDFVEVQEEITKKVVGGRFDEISGVLNSYVEKSCSNVKGGKFSPKKFDRFITAFNNELPQIPYEKERSISLSTANYIDNQDFRLKGKDPSNYLEGVSVQGNLTQVKGV